MVFTSRVSRRYKLNEGSKGPSQLNYNDILTDENTGNWQMKNTTEMNHNLGITPKKLSASCDELDSRASREDFENAKENVRNKPGFLRRVFGRKYKKLKRSKSQENLPTKALNISIEDAFDKDVRMRSRTEPVELWQENEDKTKRRLAVCEDDENNRKGFSKIVETFIVKKNMDDYCF